MVPHQAVPARHRPAAGRTGHGPCTELRQGRAPSTSSCPPSLWERADLVEQRGRPHVRVFGDRAATYSANGADASGLERRRWPGARAFEVGTDRLAVTVKV